MFIAAILSTVMVASCKEKNGDTDPSQKFVSVKSLIEQQVAHVDTSLYSIRTVLIRDSANADTTFIPREEFRNSAKDFLSIPDLGDPKIARRFKQDTGYDSLIKKVMITYTPIDPENEEVKKQEIFVTSELDNKGNNKVSSIIIEKSAIDRNGSRIQKMLWVIDQYFLITTMSEKPGQPEVVTVLKVIWNEDE